jgi:hypothetical protein
MDLAMNAFQMKGILILHLANNTILHPLENIHSSAPKKITIVAIFALERPPCYFKQPIITLIKLSTPPPSITYYKKLNISM